MCQEQPFLSGRNPSGYSCPDSGVGSASVYTECLQACSSPWHSSTDAPPQQFGAASKRTNGSDMGAAPLPFQGIGEAGWPRANWGPAIIAVCLRPAGGPCQEASVRCATHLRAGSTGAGPLWSTAVAARAPASARSALLEPKVKPIRCAETLGVARGRSGRRLRCRRRVTPPRHAQTTGASDGTRVGAPPTFSLSADNDRFTPFVARLSALR